MSGLEVLGTTASIIQLVDVATKVASRLKEYNRKRGGLPTNLKQISILLPAFTGVVRQNQTALDNNRVSETDRETTIAILEECNIQIQLLEDIVTELIPNNDERPQKKLIKVMRSLKYDSKIEKIEHDIRKYMEVLTHQGVASARNEDVTGTGPDPLIPTFINKPFTRDKDFVPRAALDEVVARTHCPDPIPRVALVGIGGVGKSQIAIEFAYQTQVKFPDAWVFWIHGGNVGRIEEGFRQIATALRLPGRDNKKAQIFEVVHAWLSNEANGRWFIIIDNADDMADFTAVPPNGYHEPAWQSTDVDASLPQVQDFLPKSSLGSILITTRNKNVAFKLTGKLNQCLEVEAMNEQEAIKLLKRRCTGTHTEAEMHDLIDHLGCMPLAISQAAAYINRRPFVTMTTYIEELKKGDQDMAQVLDSNETESHRDIRRTNSILATWYLTFKYVQQTNPSAARLLSLMCLFDRQGVERTLLLGCYNHGTADRKQRNDEARGPFPSLLTAVHKRYRRKTLTANERSKTVYSNSVFNDDCTMLTDFMLIKMAANGHDFTMHRLVQFATHRWLEANNEFQYWMKTLLVVLYDTLPNPTWDNMDEWSPLLLHTMTAILYVPYETETMYAWALLGQKVALIHAVIEDWKGAERTNRVSLEFFSRAISRKDGKYRSLAPRSGKENGGKQWKGENEHTLKSLHQLGSVLCSQGKMKEAETPLRRAWKGRCKLLGPSHPDTLSTARELDRISERQRSWAELKRQLRADPCLEASNYILHHRNYAKAEECLRKALGEKPKPWGEDAIEIIDTLAGTLVSQEKLKEAESFFRTSLQIQAHVLFPNEPATSSQTHRITYARKLEMLAELLFLRGEFNEAEGLHLRVETNLPLPDSTSTSAAEGGDSSLKDNSEAREILLRSRQGLSVVYVKLGKLSAATDLIQQVVDELTESNDTSAHMFGALYVQAGIKRIQGHYEEALQLYERAYAGLVASLGASNKNVEESLIHLESLRAVVEKGRNGTYDDSEWMELVKREGKSPLLYDGGF